MKRYNVMEWKDKKVNRLGPIRPIEYDVSADKLKRRYPNASETTADVAINCVLAGLHVLMVWDSVPGIPDDQPNNPRFLVNVDYAPES